MDYIQVFHDDKCWCYKEDNRGMQYINDKGKWNMRYKQKEQKNIQFRIDEICREMDKYYFSPSQQDELTERLANEGYGKYESVEAVRHYCR
jgi:hypothetical protein